MNFLNENQGQSKKLSTRFKNILRKRWVLKVFIFILRIIFWFSSDDLQLPTVLFGKRIVDTIKDSEK